MSLFNKNRKKVRKIQEEQRNKWDENIKKSEEIMNIMIDAAKKIDKDHPEFENLNEEEKARLFARTYEELKK